MSESQPGLMTLDADRKYRVDAAGVPTCIHPSRVGLRPDEYVGRTDQEKELSILPAPADGNSLGRWIADTLGRVGENDYDQALDALQERAHEAAIADEDFVNACREALQLLATDLSHPTAS